MKDASISSQNRMAFLNNSVVKLIDVSECNPVEAIMVLRLIVNRLDDSFKLDVMGNQVTRLAENIKKKEQAGDSRMEKTGI
jgi:hypothetical protein